MSSPKPSSDDGKPTVDDVLLYQPIGVPASYAREVMPPSPTAKVFDPQTLGQLPFRGDKLPLRRDTDPVEWYPKVPLARSAVLRLGAGPQYAAMLEAYRTIMDRIGKRVAVLSREEVMPMPNRGEFLIFLRWYDLIMEYRPSWRPPSS